MTESAALHDICDDRALDARPARRLRRPSHLHLALIALALGGFAIGTTEFVTMGLLPQIAQGVGISIPTAGHVVSAYALGVVVGAPTIATLAAKVPRKKLLLWLMVAFALGNIGSALSPSYPVLLVARFISGVPHGAYFGIGSLVAASMVDKSRRTWAVSIMLAGLTVANIIGVPVATLIGQRAGWEWAYAVVGVVALVTVVAVLAWVPTQSGDLYASARNELRSLRRLQVWLALGIGTVGFGGMFATFSYIAPTMTHLAGFSDAVIPLVLMVYGIGMTLGTLTSGRLVAYGMMRGITGALLAIAVVLALFGFAAHSPWTAIPAVLALGFVPSLLVPMLQTRLMDVAHEGQSLAAALNHATLNIANAFGAWLGGAVLASGLGYEWPSRVGAVLALLGLAIAGVSAWVGRRAPMTPTAA
ncbi:MFS transporter [Leekyejoonella antrihumi]|uniref:MFS transporter n=1 Tax=Leekyejoonella antrihumi TaxID=1660198 RepID=UPI001FEA0D10|nr:MFS transporter [Leekyejoonella antrihumi]